LSSIEIQCHCGAVAVELTGEALAHAYCHCDDCQAVHGAACVPVAIYPASSVNVIRGDPTTWKLKTTPRTTCRHCGTRLFASPPFGIRGVIATLLPAGHFKPTLHIYCQHARLPVKDDLPHYKTVPASFGGSDDVTDW
jgi:hypothetical protein